MKFLTGDDTGLIKVVHVEKQKAQLLILQFEDVWESSTLVSRTLVFWKFHVNPMWVIVPSYTKLCFSICVVQAQRAFLYVRQETLAVLRLQQHGIAKIETEHTANDHLKLRSKERYSTLTQGIVCFGCAFDVYSERPWNTTVVDSASQHFRICSSSGRDWG